ncbi:fimbria/pilus outer membrane usher protein [Collimonas humicola]|uniref:fimbria/pilus outer membrane usher protein n=1 Tax=Collimonas humicola TaxID=2825886 RepID=UPI001B8C8AE9|nr:fimbria/pilus outer membrane usher protein [Collimonas humicola]
MRLKLMTGLISALLHQGVYADATAGSQGFDLDTLRARGLAVEVAELFSEGKRFLPGPQQIKLMVNGVRLGRAQAEFSRSGALCMDRQFLARAHIAIPEKVDANACIDLEAAFPQTIIHLRPSQEEVELIVPQEALRPAAAADSAGTHTSGGKAALLNYDLLYMTNRYGGSSNNTLQVSTEAGVNVNDWILRSRQNYSYSNGVAEFNHLDAYVQKTLIERKSVFQIGQINVNGSLFATPNLLGVQLFPEGALLRQAATRVKVEGIAQTQARVEVKQHNVLLYSTIVPPGPFSLSDIALNNANIDLQVTVFEANGGEHGFTVPASSFAIGFTPKEKGYSLAFGKPWNYGDDSEQGSNNWLLTAMADFPMGSRLNVSGAGLLANGFYAAGTQLTGMPVRGLELGISTLFSHSAEENTNGMQMMLSTGTQMTEVLTLNASYAIQTQGFRNFSDIGKRYATTTYPQDEAILPARAQQQASFNLSYNHRLFGGISMGYSQFQGFAGDNSRRVNLRWAKAIKNAHVSLNVERAGGSSRDTAVYAALSMPFGSKSVSASVSSNNRRQRAGMTMNERVSDFLGYSLATETDDQSRQVATSANLSLLPKYLQSSVGWSRYGANSTSMSARVTGGAVLHDKGFTLSPYPVRDTFTVLSVANIGDVKIQTPQGPVWTDAAGYAIAPAMPAYADGRLELISKSLPKNADIKNGLYVLGMGRGAVGKVDFDVIQTRRVLLKLRDQQGQPLTKSNAVFNQQDQWISSVGNHGDVFLSWQQVQGPLKVTNGQGQSCIVNVILPEQVPKNAFYENAEAVCRNDI